MDLFLQFSIHRLQISLLALSQVKFHFMLRFKLFNLQFIMVLENFSLVIDLISKATLHHILSIIGIANLLLQVFVQKYQLIILIYHSIELIIKILDSFFILTNGILQFSGQLIFFLQLEMQTLILSSYQRRFIFQIDNILLHVIHISKQVFTIDVFVRTTVVIIVILSGSFILNLVD